MKGLCGQLTGQSIKASKDRYVKSICNEHLTKILSSSSNLNCNKPFWHYIKSQKKDQTRISSLKTTNGVATTPAEKAEVLNNAFHSVFTTSSLPTLPVSTHPSLPEISIAEHGIFTLLSQIDLHKACGPDNIPAWVLQELAQDSTPMITHLSKQSLDIGELPLEWKTDYVTLIFKKDKRSDSSNYWLVSLTSILRKKFGHILVSQIINHLETYQILCPNQFTFRVKHSC